MLERSNNDSPHKSCFITNMINNNKYNNSNNDNNSNNNNNNTDSNKFIYDNKR